MTVLELITASFRLLNVAVEGEDLETTVLDNGREALNLLLASWYDDGIVYPGTGNIDNNPLLKILKLLRQGRKNIP